MPDPTIVSPDDPLSMHSVIRRSGQAAQARWRDRCVLAFTGLVARGDCDEDDLCRDAWRLGTKLSELSEL